MKTTDVDRLARVLLEDAVAEAATDVHLNPTAEGMRLRYRVDGALRTVKEFPTTVREALTEALLRLGGRPADGSVNGRINLDDAEFRLSVLPSVFGPNLVLRALDQRPQLRTLDELGMADETLAEWRGLAHQPGGLMVVTGPTGCGKTSTLYATLLERASSTRNTVTVEDPVECVLDWTVQSAVGPAQSFPAALRAVLSQDPDVILCSEVREADSGRLLCEMALTGHLVFTAMHTNDGPDVMARLVAAGIPAVLVGSAVRGILAQRLVRNVCGDCRAERVLTEQEKAWLREAGVEVVRRTHEGRGCERCGGTGYRGRSAVFHLLRPTDEMRQLLSQVERGEATLDALRRLAARESGTLRRCALEAAVRGQTTLREAHWVTQLAPVAAD